MCFSLLAWGLACGMGYIGYAVLFAMILCAEMAILQIVHFGQPKTARMTLKITVPENLNFHGLFDDLLERYTVFWTRKKVKTSDFGALFEVVYDIQMKEEAEQKAFLDAIRQRNGNLNISLTLAGEQGGNVFSDRFAILLFDVFIPLSIWLRPVCMHRTELVFALRSRVAFAFF